MKKFVSLFLILGFSGGMSTVHAQNDICKIEDYVKGTMDNATKAHIIFLNQCRKYPSSRVCQYYEKGFAIMPGDSYDMAHHLENCRYFPDSTECEYFLNGRLNKERCCKRHPDLCDNICNISDYKEDNEGKDVKKKKDNDDKERTCECNKEFENWHKKGFKEGFETGRDRGLIVGVICGALLTCLVGFFTKDKQNIPENKTVAN